LFNEGANVDATVADVGASTPPMEEKAMHSIIYVVGLVVVVLAVISLIA
jgi:hypothetical protein